MTGNKWIWGLVGLGIGYAAAKWVVKRKEMTAGTERPMATPLPAGAGTEGTVGAYYDPQTYIPTPNPAGKAYGAESAATSYAPPTPRTEIDGRRDTSHDFFEESEDFGGGDF